MQIFYLKAVLIAIIEGLTEFIPISSTGHMILFGNLCHFTGEKVASFEIFIQSGAIMAVVLIYWERFRGLVPQKKPRQNVIKALFYGDSHPTGFHVLLAILPILVSGFLLYHYIKSYLFSPITVSIGLIIGGIIMIVVELIPRRYTVSNMEQIGLKQSFIVGLGQCLALWPGMSRSGSTMSTGLLLGIRHKAIADFSFFIAVPVMLIAVVYDITKTWQLLEPADTILFGLGFFVAFVVAWGSIKWFLKILTRVRLLPFGLYRILIGCICLWFFWA